MMIDKYSIEEIEAALAKTYVSKVDQQELITALQGPKQMFRKGEVTRIGIEYGVAHEFNKEAWCNMRHLTQTEAGPWGEAVRVAMEALGDIRNYIEYKIEQDDADVIATEALARIKEILPERIRGNDE